MATTENHLIELLSRKDRVRFLAICKPVELALGSVLCEPGTPMKHVYFPVDAFISLLTPVDSKPALEVGMVGREGMLGAHLALGVMTAPLHALVQGEGRVWRVGSTAFRRELAENLSLQRCMDRYLYVLMSQLAGSAACLRFHQIDQRLARWLLMSQDRAHSDRFPVTQEFLAYMLGVRRVGITAAAGGLQHRGLIEYRRGDLSVLDRAGLQAAACSCYANDRQVYDQLLK